MTRSTASSIIDMNETNQRTRDALKPVLHALHQQTEGCRGDMHEPDEQDVSAVVKGDHLDNAMGADPDFNHGELTVGIKKGVHTLWFNLADLIALARQAKL